MQNVYLVTYKKYNSDICEIYVLAKTIAKGIENAERWLKKNSYSSTEIIQIERRLKVDVVYK